MIGAVSGVASVVSSGAGEGSSEGSGAGSSEGSGAGSSEGSGAGSSEGADEGSVVEVAAGSVVVSAKANRTGWDTNDATTATSTTRARIGYQMVPRPACALTAFRSFSLLLLRIPAPF